jgi:ABC-type multidrug transport system permease subunit
MFWTFGFPILLAIALGIAFRNRPPEPVDVVVERRLGSDAIASALAADRDVRSKTMSPDDAAQALRTGKVALVVVPGTPRTYRFDPTRPEGRLARVIVDDVLQRADGRRDPTVTSDARTSEPGSRYIDFLLPGLIGMGLMSSGLWGVGYTIVDMRTRKLIKRLVAMPMKKRDFLLAFVAVRGLFLVIELPVLIGFGNLVFGVPIHGSIALLLAIATLGSLMFAGIGVLVASRAENTQTMNGLVNLVTLPMFIASGSFFSSSRFPDAVQPVLRVLPLTALNDALRAVMLEGAGPVQIAVPIAIMLGWGLVSYVLALRLFRWA